MVPAVPSGVRLAVLPAVALLLLAGFELTPLPPGVIGTLSPATYRLNQISFPGWPLVSPAQESAALEAGFSRNGVAHAEAPEAGYYKEWRGVGGWRWRTLAIAPEATASALIEWLALGALFATITLYPFGLIGERGREDKFYRTLIATILLTGIVVAAEGLLQRAWWNGRLLWIWTARDWGGPLLTSAPRASGPFVDADHFANYLAMVLPLAVVGALFPVKIVPAAQHANFRLMAALGALLIGFALLFSLSRAGWVAAVAGMGVALTLASGEGSESARTQLSARFRTGRLWVIAGAIATAIALMAFVIGTGGRDEVGARLSAAHDSLSYRPAVWRDTLKMVADFPLFGVGLGGWPDLFPHYRRPPWSPLFFRQAENDYLQLAAELGLIGVALTVWLTAELAVGFTRDSNQTSGRYRALLAGVAGGVAATLVHEGFDFSLRTPANAWLFVSLMALAFRLATEKRRGPEAGTIRQALAAGKGAQRGAAALACAVLAMIAVVYWQDGAAYPYAAVNAKQAGSILDRLRDHPAMAGAHLALAEALATRANERWRDAEMQAALWLDPNDPATRDRYARELLASGKKRAGLGEIELSVERSPELHTHYYLNGGVIPWLLPEEQAAIAGGLEKAVERGYSGARESLAEFYRELGRYDDLGKLFQRLAAQEARSSQKVADLSEAGRDYALGGDEANAIGTLRAAIAINPQDARPYAELARVVYGPRHEINQARRVIEEGLRAGADREQLEIALADANAAAGNTGNSEQALEAALRARPSMEVAMRLGTLYLNDGQAGRAVIAFERATEIEPDSAEAWFALGEARERDFDYTAAGNAYERAQALAPKNRYYASVRDEFARRMARPAEDVNAHQ